MDDDLFMQPTPRSVGLTGLLMKWRIAKDVKTANSILLSLAVLLFVAAGFVVWNGFQGDSNERVLPPHAQKQLEE